MLKSTSKLKISNQISMTWKSMLVQRNFYTEIYLFYFPSNQNLSLEKFNSFKSVTSTQNVLLKKN